MENLINKVIDQYDYYLFYESADRAEQTRAVITAGANAKERIIHALEEHYDAEVIDITIKPFNTFGDDDFKIRVTVDDGYTEGDGYTEELILMRIYNY